MDNRFVKPALVCALTSLLFACGGGGGSSETTTPPTSSTGWVAGQFAPSEQFKGQCAALNQKNWLRSWSNETYLWYDEITDRDPASVADVIDYFDLLITEEKTASGANKDNFHFSIPTAEWEQSQQSGSVMGYGFNYKIVKAAPPREVYVSYTEPDTAATTAGVQRGWEIVDVNGVDVVNANSQEAVDAINAAFFPSQTGVQTDFTFKLVGSNEERTITLTSAQITQDSVMNVKTVSTTTGNVGYVQFNDHNAPAERELYDAFNYLAAQNVSDLVIDMRYNGGGYLAMAAQLGYMIAGSANTSNLVFERTIFNNNPSNPLSENAQSFPFFDEYIGFDPDSGVSEGSPLPSLNLERVFILTTGNTCSASEALINGLRGIPQSRGFEVVLIGGKTCGKPYGFYPTDNCDTTFFTIQFTGVNNAGFGEYAEGFAPQNYTSSNFSPVRVTGCAVADDFTHLLGDTNEAMFNAALDYRTSGACPAPTSTAGLKGYAVSDASAQIGESISDNRWQSTLRNNRIMTPLNKESQ
ncbi:S41 family peptidase [Pseudoalteromonas sp. GB56]